MTRRLNILYITIFLLFYSCNQPSSNNTNQLEEELQACLKSGLNTEYVNLYDKIIQMDSLLIQNKIVQKETKNSYSKLLFALLKDSMQFDVQFFDSNRNLFLDIISPSTASVIVACYSETYKKLKLNNESEKNKLFIICQLLKTLNDDGDLGNDSIIHQYFNCLTDSDFQCEIYKLPIIYLITQFGEHNHKSDFFEKHVFTSL